MSSLHRPTKVSKGLIVKFLTLITLGAPILTFGDTVGEGTYSEIKKYQQQKSKTVIEEILVTANFRSQSIQDVAGAVSGYDANRIKDLGASDIGDLAKFTPSLNNNDRGPGQNDLNIRGMGKLAIVADTIPSPSPVGMYLDGISINTLATGQADVEFFGMQIVEVLRGAQGTLYGESAEGGAVKFISRDPNLSQFEGELALDAISGDYSGLGFGSRLLIDKVLIDDTLGLILSGGFTTNGGFIDNTRAEQENVNEYDKETFRGVLLARMPSDIDLRLSLHYNKNKLNAAQIVDTTSGKPRPVISYQNADDTGLDDFLLIPLKISYNADSYSVESISGYYKRDTYFDRYNGFTAVFASAVYYPSTGGDFADGHLKFNADYEQYTQELRFISNWDGAFDIIAGAYYRSFEYSTAALGYSKDIDGLIVYDGGDLDQKSTQLSYYTELSWKISEQLATTVGLRRHSENLATNSTETHLYSQETSTPLPTGLIPINGPTRVNSTTIPELYHEFELKDWLPMLRIEYSTNDESLYYFRYSTGLRNGNINIALSTFINSASAGNPDKFGPNNPDNTFGPDFVNAYEIGAKMTLLDGSWTLNSSLFYNDWTDLQVIKYAPIATTFNAGRAHSYGLEIESLLIISENWSVFAGSAITVAETTERINLSDDAFIEKGAKIPYAQDYAYSVGVAFNKYFENGLSFKSTFSYSYTGPFIQDIASTNSPDPEQGGRFGLANFTIDFGTETLKAHLKINNIFNKFVVVSTLPADKIFEDLTGLPPTEGQSIDENYTNMPREVSVGINYYF